MANTSTALNATWLVLQQPTASEIFAADAGELFVNSLISVTLIVSSLLVIVAARDPLTVTHGGNNVRQLSLGAYLGLLFGVLINSNLIFIKLVDGPLDVGFCSFYGVVLVMLDIAIGW